MNARARTALLLLVLALGLTLLAACGGPSDTFAGTWVEPSDTSTQMVIDKNDDGSYTIKDPDGSNAWTAAPSGNTLKGTVAYTPKGASKPVDVAVAVTITGETGKFVVSVNGASQSFDLKRK